MSDNVEQAMTLCQLGKMLLKGSEAKGADPFSVNLKVSCPQGKPIGIWHSHPLAGGGEPKPSAQDYAEAKRLNLSALCVSVPEKNITKCYKVK